MPFLLIIKSQKIYTPLNSGEKSYALLNSVGKNYTPRESGTPNTFPLNSPLVPKKFMLINWDHPPSKPRKKRVNINFKSGVLHKVPKNWRKKCPVLKTYPKINANGIFNKHTLNRREWYPFSEAYLIRQGLPNSLGSWRIKGVEKCWHAARAVCPGRNHLHVLLTLVMAGGPRIPREDPHTTFLCAMH